MSCYRLKDRAYDREGNDDNDYRSDGISFSRGRCVGGIVCRVVGSVALGDMYALAPFGSVVGDFIVGMTV